MVRKPKYTQKYSKTKLLQWTNETVITFILGLLN